MQKATLYDKFLRYLARKLFLYANMTSKRVPENYKPCVIIVEGPYATLYWAQFMETDIQ